MIKISSKDVVPDFGVKVRLFWWFFEDVINNFSFGRMLRKSRILIGESNPNFSVMNIKSDDWRLDDEIRSKNNL